MKRANQRKLVTYAEAVKLKKQHSKPCADCPWGRKSIKGWLGGDSPETWIQAAHGEARIDCHTTNQQCAGAAIYRANVIKSCRDKTILSLKPNKKIVFSTPWEFLKHHYDESNH